MDRSLISGLKIVEPDIADREPLYFRIYPTAIDFEDGSFRKKKVQWMNRHLLDAQRSLSAIHARTASMFFRLL